jgi:hypothetical protein
MKRKPLPAPRNPFVASAKFKKAGAHKKGGKSLRRNKKMELQRESGRVTDRVADRTGPLTRQRTGSNPSAPTRNSYAWRTTRCPKSAVVITAGAVAIRMSSSFSNRFQ